MPTWLATAIAPLAEAGFDIAHEFDATAIAPTLVPDRTWSGAVSGLLVGNTRALWPRFIAAHRADPALAADPDPLDRYTEQTIARVAGTAHAVFSHRPYAGAFLPFQQVAIDTGLGTWSPGHLAIHPVYGPWFALRAIVLGEGESPPRTPIQTPCLCREACSAALATARAAQGPESWRAWLAIRDACTVGRAYRYDDDQLHYHYTKDPSSLR